VLIRGARVPGQAEGAYDALLEGGRIRAMARRIQAPAEAEVVDAGGLWLLPGWIDIQVNDMEWIAGWPRQPPEHAARIREVLRYQAERGVTGLVLATLAAPLEEVVAYLRGMKVVLESQGSALDGAFLGGLVEGTFMNPELCGAHNSSWVLPPEMGTVDRLLETGAVRLLNIAPEASPQALECIARAASRGVVVGAGHAKPHAERLRQAVAAGLKYIIHLGNGPTGSSLKAFHDGGMLEESLRNDRLVATIIADGCHIHPRLVRDWIRRKEVARVIAVSDAGFATGMPAGEFEVCGVRGRVSADGSYLKVVPRLDARPANPLSSDFGALFGSVAGMREVFENIVNLLSREMEGVYYRSHPALDLAGAVEAACRLTSTNPAALLGLTDRGVLAAGKRGDALLVELQGSPGAYRVRLHGTWLGRGGR
jgi:N-acetylglucosamine-6-phosphate deacetylase